MTGIGAALTDVTNFYFFLLYDCAQTKNVRDARAGLAREFGGGRALRPQEDTYSRRSLARATAEPAAACRCSLARWPRCTVRRRFSAIASACEAGL